MMEFLKGALPFVIIGICLAILFANHRKKGNGEDKENYLMEGMCFGMCFGVVLSSLIHIDLGIGISFGMLIGETVGALIKKKNV